MIGGVDMDENIYKTVIGEQVKKRRTKIGMSQKKLAILCDISDAQVNRIEKGISFPSIPLLVRLSGVLMTDFNYFFLYTLKDLTLIEQEVLNLYRTLDDEKRNILYSVLISFAEGNNSQNLLDE
jgi:transcriptional regulator with XRE-family HTH domain